MNTSRYHLGISFCVRNNKNSYKKSRVTTKVILTPTLSASAVKMNLRIITKSHAGDPEKGVSQKIDFKAVWPRNGHAASLGVNALND